MNERELRQALKEGQERYNQAKADGKGADELRTIVDEIKELREKLDLEIEARGAQLPEATSVTTVTENRAIEQPSDEDVEQRYSDMFFRVIRNAGRMTQEDRNVLEEVEQRAKDNPTATPYLQSTVDENGGLLVPKDVNVQINEYKRTQPFDLSTLITVEQTSFTSGSRVFEKLTAQTPFANITEWDKIEDIPAPQFEKKEYSMKDFAGILPTPRTLLQDTVANLLAHLAKYIARKSIFTRNAEILKVLKTLKKRTKAVVFTDDLKDILNVELDGAFASGAVIVTNQDGYNWLDKCKDEKGNYLMQKDIVNGTGYTLLNHSVEVVPNSILPSTAKKAPLFIGDLKTAVILFDRGLYEIKATDVGGQSFVRNSYDIRVIDRFDVQKWDEDAVIHTEIDTSKEPAFPSTATKPTAP